jgi:hypothetical protein
MRWRENEEGKFGNAAVVEKDCGVAMFEVFGWKMEIEEEVC